MNILITGHKGMIGGRLFEILSKRSGVNVSGIDIADGTGDVRYFLQRKTYDIILHCAAKTSVTESMCKPQGNADTNILGTINMLDNNPDAKFIFLSTAGIYGEGKSHKETDKPFPLSPYAASKLAAEYYVKIMAKDYVILRLANVIGGEKREPNVFQIFEKSDTLNIFGDGRQTRDFIHVNDVCRAVENSFDKTGIFNIGTGKSVTILSVAKMFNKPIEFYPARAGEIKNFGLNVSKAKRCGLLENIKNIEGKR
jgi:UDP-glucose 4-epimerase